jgi:hypothetical protein
MMTDKKRVRAQADEPEKPVKDAAGGPSVIDDLRDLITALDRRTPQLERKGEHDIAIVAAALRAEAVHRIAQHDGAAPAANVRTLLKK